ncbi:hypothetical protein TNCV_2555811 [Trichonephila clavipes]|nr:hypothetical protein TNCV_2555811 [Trichonephila clavipes]
MEVDSEEPVQVSSSSLNRCYKLRSPLTIAIVLLQNATKKSYDETRYRFNAETMAKLWKKTSASAAEIPGSSQTTELSAPPR